MIKIKALPVFILILSAVAGCSSSPSSSNLGGTHFYSLSSMKPSSAMTANKISIGIGPVEIPRLLNRPQIVSRKNKSEIIMSEKHQWGGSYKEELNKAITDNLSILLKTERIEQYPWKSTFKPDYQVRINIESFDGDINSPTQRDVTLNARWRLIKNDKELLVKRALITVPLKNSGYAAYVNAQSEAINRFSHDIVAQIRKQP
jgi:uncharacterized lipoprotein YmbA